MKNISKRNKITALLLITVLLSTMLLAGCQPKQVELVDQVVGREKLDGLLEDPTLVKSAQYEKVDKAYLILGTPSSLSPSDPAYRGIIKLTEENGEKLFTEHKWNEYTGSLPTFTYFDTTPLAGDTWYVVGVHDWNFFKNYYPPDYFLFNGKDTIIFCVQTY